MKATIFAGFGNGILWTIVGMYITLCSIDYARITSQSFSKIQTLFFGIFSSLYLISKRFLSGNVHIKKRIGESIKDLCDF